jgi:hypothetical protein
MADGCCFLLEVLRRCVCVHNRGLLTIDSSGGGASSVRSPCQAQLTLSACLCTCKPLQKHLPTIPAPALQAQIARLSGACYLDWGQLKAAAREDHFDVVAGSDTYFTRWYVARGVLRSGLADGEPETPVTCVIFRGVMWRSAEVNSLRVWQQLSQSWAAPFMEGELAALAHGGVVQAHAGMAAMAAELQRALTPHLLAHAGAAPTCRLRWRLDRFGAKNAIRSCIVNGRQLILNLPVVSGPSDNFCSSARGASPHGCSLSLRLQQLSHINDSMVVQVLSSLLGTL